MTNDPKTSRGWLAQRLGEGFDPEGWLQADLTPPPLDRLRRLNRIVRPVGRYFRAELTHAERIPKGGALLVGNHATWGIDSFALVPLLFEATGRPVRGLAERLLFANATARRVWHALGVVPGTRAIGRRLLQEGELCLCYPGGDRDASKYWWGRHTLEWAGRIGYLRTAIGAGVPIVPVLGVGIDDAFPVFAHDRLVWRRLLGGARYDLPFYLTAAGIGCLTGPFAIPLPVRFHFEVGEPIWVEASEAQRAQVVAGDRSIEPWVRARHAEVWRRVQAMLDDLARRHDAPRRARWARRLKTWLG